MREIKRSDAMGKMVVVVVVVVVVVDVVVGVWLRRVSWEDWSVPQSAELLQRTGWT